MDAWRDQVFCEDALQGLARIPDGVIDLIVADPPYGVINVLADGTAIGQRPGCGRAGDQVMLYFPKTGIALQQPLFKQGGQRVDTDIGIRTIYRLQAPLMAADGVN